MRTATGTRRATLSKAPSAPPRSLAASSKKSPARRRAAIVPAPKKPDPQTAEFLKAIKALKGYF